MAFYDMGGATVRCDNCELLVPQQLESVGVVKRCGKCNEYRKTLNRMLFRIESRKETTLTSVILKAIPTTDF